MGLPARRLINYHYVIHFYLIILIGVTGFAPPVAPRRENLLPPFLFKAHLSVDNEHNIISTTFIPFPVDNKPFKEQRNQDEKQKQYEKKYNKRQKDTVHSSQSCLENSHDIKSDV